MPVATGATADIVAALMARNAAAEKLVVSQASRIAALERRLGLDSSNSGKPPSGDGLKKPRRTRRLRLPSGKKSGGQKGHPGSTLRQVEEPDAAIEHFPEACADCGGASPTEASEGFTAR